VGFQSATIPVFLTRNDVSNNWAANFNQFFVNQQEPRLKFFEFTCKAKER
jgi:hypothetical protein